MKCPGTDARFLKVEEIKCRCGNTVEVFSDEPGAKCRKCGKCVYKKMPSCIDWCRYAKECLGEKDRRSN